MKRLLIFSSIVLFVTACGPSSSGSPTTPTMIPATLVPSQTVFPSPTAANPPTSGSLLGAYDNSQTPRGLETLTLIDGGRYSLQVEGHTDKPVTGTWAISEGQIVFTEAAGTGDCPGYPGTYKFVMDGKALTFTKVKDAYCDFRVGDLTSGPWIKTP